MGHVPDVNSIEGIVQLLTLCMLVVLSNVLDFRTYAAPNQGEDEAPEAFAQKLHNDYDRNDIPATERLAICYARGVALAVMEAISNSCTIVYPDGSIAKDLPYTFVAEQMQAIAVYKQAATTLGHAKYQGAPHCTTNRVREQLLNVARWNSSIGQYYAQPPTTTELELGIGCMEGCSVEWTTSPLQCVEGML